MTTVSLSIRHTQYGEALTISQQSLSLHLLDETVDLVHLIQSLFGPAITFDDLFNSRARRPNVFG